MPCDFVHPPLGAEVRTIGGGYTFLREATLAIGGRQLFYLVGAAEIDASCCGVGGCGYAFVPGFVSAWKARESADGRPISAVEPVDDEATRRHLAQQIQATELVQEVQFWSPKEEVP